MFSPAWIKMHKGFFFYFSRRFVTAAFLLVDSRA
jgi:hypothetical protein